jgi:transposase-like protein
VVFVEKRYGSEGYPIHKEMQPTCGEHCLSRQTIHNWVQKFSEGRTSIEDKRRVGRPVEIATPAGQEFYAAGFQGLLKRWDKCLMCMEIMLKNKCCLYVIIPIRFYSITICNLLIEVPS